MVLVKIAYILLFLVFCCLKWLSGCLFANAIGSLKIIALPSD